MDVSSFYFDDDLKCIANKEDKELCFGPKLLSGFTNS